MPEPTTASRAVEAFRTRMPEHLRGLDVSRVEIPAGETPEDAAARREAQAAGRRSHWLRRLPRMYAGARFSTLREQQDPKGRVTGWLDTDSPTLLLVGEADRGKTHAAYAVGAEGVARGLWAAAWTLADLNAAMRPDGDATAYDVAVSCELLVLDDLGREQVTAWSLEQLQRIIDARTRDGRRTVVTTNLSYDALLERYGAPIVGRLRADAVIVKVEGPSMRKEAPW